MKFITTLVILLSLNTLASEYNCIDKNNQTGVLSVDNYSKTIHWFQYKNAKASIGVPAGIEKAPYSPWKGYALFRLTQWPMTNDSSWIVAIQPNKQIDPAIVVYFDNDDHPENERAFRCIRTKY